MKAKIITILTIIFIITACSKNDDRLESITVDAKSRAAD